MTLIRLAACIVLSGTAIVGIAAHADTLSPADPLEPDSARSGHARDLGSGIDSVLVLKSERKLYLIKDGRRIREMDIALGLAPIGRKEQSGDFRTPEGSYLLDAKNPDSDYFLSIHVSYPNADDRRHAADRGVDPGGQIMIHGLPNQPKRDERSYSGWDWTDGCIAVSNSDMVDLWLLVGENTPIDIRP